MLNFLPQSGTWGGGGEETAHRRRDIKLGDTSFLAAPDIPRRSPDETPFPRIEEQKKPEL